MKLKLIDEALISVSRSVNPAADLLIFQCIIGRFYSIFHKKPQNYYQARKALTASSLMLTN